MPEYKDEDIMKYMNAAVRVYDVIGVWNDANLLSRNRDVNYMRDVLGSATEIPDNLRNGELRKKISILEEAVKIVEDKNKNLGASAINSK